MRLQAPPCELLPPLYPRGPRSGPGYVVPVHPRLTTLAFDAYGRSRHFLNPHTPILVREPLSGLYCRSLSLPPVDWLASLVGADQASPANRGFYFPAFDGWITRPAAGCHYGGHWASSSGGILTR
jgi:hypothetical protein